MLMTVPMFFKLMNRTWIADSVASSHIMNDDKGLYQMKKFKELIKIGNGKIIYAMKIGTLDFLTSLHIRSTATFTLKTSSLFLTLD